MRRFLAKMWNRVERLHKDDNKTFELPDKKCFILATGPSINRITKLQWKNLRRQFSIGVNGAFKKHICNVYCCADTVFLEPNYGEMLKYKPWLLFESARSFSADKYFYHHFGNIRGWYTYTHLGNCVDWDRISFDISKGAYSGHTVVVEAIQVALSAGCKEIYLLGVDLDYSGVSYFYGDDNPNPIYPEGRKDVTPLVNAFKVVKRECDKRGIRIYNCSPTSKLDVFPFKRLSEALR
jgi:hypothetical protein